MAYGNPSQEVKGDVYLAYTSTRLKCDSWMIDSNVSYHMRPHKKWLCEYEMFNGYDVLLGDDSPTKIIGRGKV